MHKIDKKKENSIKIAHEIRKLHQFRTRLRNKTLRDLDEEYTSMEEERQAEVEKKKDEKRQNSFRNAKILIKFAINCVVFANKIDFVIGRVAGGAVG